MKSVLSAVALAVCAGAGCATTSSSFVPVGPGANGGPAERYPIPPEAPQGEVYVTSFGFTDFDLGPNQPGTMLHARLAVSNGSAQAWTVDGRRQTLIAEGRPAQTPAFANSDAGAGPVYVVPPGRTAVMDFYYSVVPPLSGFALDWSVDSGGRPIAERTAFLRVEEPPRAYGAYPPYVVVGLGFGAGWWYGPHYPYAYHYRPTIRHSYPPPSVWRGHPAPAPGWRGAPVRGGGAWRRH